MSEEQLYTIARQSIDRKNRRWLLWGLNLIAFLLYVGAFTAYPGIPRNMGGFIEQAWFALMVAHSTALVLMHDSEAGIDGEIARLCKGTHEKPKRRELSETIEAANPRMSRN